MLTIAPEAMMVLPPDGRATPQVIGEAWANAHRALRSALADPEIHTCVVMVGNPGSGKSAWLRDQGELPGVVAFDAVHSERGRRAAMARRIKAAGKRPVAVLVTCPLALAIARNEGRPPERKVPEAYLRRSWVELQHWPPELAEGWSEIVVVPGSDVRADRRTTEENDAGKRTFYRWRTQGDGRVRPAHAARHGRIFSWPYPPEGGHPGSDFGCRCFPEMVSDSDVVEDVNGNLRARPLTVPAWARKR